MAQGAALRQALFVAVAVIIALLIYVAAYAIFFRHGPRGQRMQEIHAGRSMLQLGPMGEQWLAALKITPAEHVMYWLFLPCYRVDWSLRT
ncbi:MAG TPA: hypothetical protein VEL07_17595 [Planctomycetota bacterium]|nr:hypothetical protein [Planctomycetota bacterium]